MRYFSHGIRTSDWLERSFTAFMLVLLSSTTSPIRTSDWLERSSTAFMLVLLSSTTSPITHLNLALEPQCLGELAVSSPQTRVTG